LAFGPSGEEHENIVSLRGVCLNPPCVITEYMELGNLHGYLEDHRNVIEWRQVVAVARDVARGMHFLHTQTPPKIHRDLKSPNILVRFPFFLFPFSLHYVQFYSLLFKTFINYSFIYLARAAQ
jgi:serine/threonine protein kinase